MLLLPVRAGPGPAVFLALPQPARHPALLLTDHHQMYRPLIRLQQHTMQAPDSRV